LFVPYLDLFPLYSASVRVGSTLFGSDLYCKLSRNARVMMLISEELGACRGGLALFCVSSFVARGEVVVGDGTVCGVTFGALADGGMSSSSSSLSSLREQRSGTSVKKALRSQLFTQ
jgi:hypothetical protein